MTSSTDRFVWDRKPAFNSTYYLTVSYKCISLRVCLTFAENSNKPEGKRPPFPGITLCACALFLFPFGAAMFATAKIQLSLILHFSRLLTCSVLPRWVVFTPFIHLWQGSSLPFALRPRNSSSFRSGFGRRFRRYFARCFVSVGASLSLAPILLLTCTFSCVFQ